MTIRSSDPAYLDAIAEYLDAVYEIMRPRQIQNGGPVVLVQIENEYGAYGADKDYLRTLTAMTRTRGIDVPLTTVDQPEDAMLQNGSLDELHRTGSFGSRASERLATLRQHQKTGPLMCSEFWCGWFDNWGGKHNTTSAEDSARELDALLTAGASVNVYMFHGGTNFGFTSGADDKGTYRPTITSYDYDAPLAEDGTPTEKYWRFREVIAKHASVPDEVPTERVDAPAFDVPIERAVSLWQTPILPGSGFEHVPTDAELRSPRGFSHYSRRIESGGLLAFGEVRDRAQVFLDGVALGTVSRDLHERMLPLPFGAGGELTILVEHMGGVNYGKRLGEAKGLIGPITLGGVPLLEWTAGAVDLEDLDGILAAVDAAPRVSDGAALCGPVFAAGSFELERPTDLFLDTSDWGKGVVWVNGFNLGRYWRRGPQRTLIVPGPVLRPGPNEILVFETSGATSSTARFVARPELGSTEQ